MTSRTSSLRCWARTWKTVAVSATKIINWAGSPPTRHPVSSVQTTSAVGNLIAQHLILPTDRTGDAPQGILRDRRLGQADAGVQSEDGGDLAHRNTEPVMGGVRRGHDPRPHPVGGGPVLIGGEVRVRRPHGDVTGRAAVDPDAIGLHDRPGLRWNLGDGGEVDALLPQHLPAAETGRLGQSDLDWGSGPLVGPGQGAEGEGSLPRLASWALGWGFALALGEGGSLSLRVPRPLLELSPQCSVLRREFIDAGFQRGELGE